MAQENEFEYFDSINKFANENQSIKRKQTAVAWIEDNIQSDMTFMEIIGLIRQAKAMEKEQIMNAFLEGKINHNKDWAIEYYNKTYNK